MAHFKTKEALDRAMDARWNAMRLRHPRFCASFLEDMHELLDWYEHKLNHIKDHKAMDIK